MNPGRYAVILAIMALLVGPNLVSRAAHAAGSVVITNCANDTQLRLAATSSGVTTITFDCGPSATIPVTGYMAVSGDVTIDGGKRVALDGGGLSPFFQVFSGHSLTLRNLTLQNARGSGIHPLENFGTLTLEVVQVLGNRSDAEGGAIYNSGDLVVSGSRFENNQSGLSNSNGGAIWQSSGSTTIDASTFLGNKSSGSGGAIGCANGDLKLTGSTIAGSVAIANGAAIYSTCTTTIVNSTLSGNAANGGGGGLYLKDATGTVTFTTMAGNTAVFGAGVYHEGSGVLSMQATLLASNATGNCDGIVASLGYNLSSDMNCSAFTQTGDAQNQALPLGALQLNGGTTATRMPLAGNPAINAIPAPCPASVDQRGVARPQAGLCDIGAVEVNYGVALPLVVR